MAKNDYLMEFHCDLTAAVEREISRQKEKMLWGGTDLSRAVFNYEWYRHLTLRDEYVNRRKSGRSGGLEELRWLPQEWLRWFSPTGPTGW